ncbi:hypothetical protein Q8F55_003742 [Vanrija albida]|uniref:Uncharacterized protein n=1 Tax=Vanrija albida TaxID=181172 RepID=A0ABR3Q527_9TREE
MRHEAEVAAKSPTGLPPQLPGDPFLHSLLAPTLAEPRPRLTPSGRPKPVPRPANIVDPPRNRRPSHSGLNPRDSRVGTSDRPPVSYRNSRKPSHRRRLSLIEVLADKDFAANPANVIGRDVARSHDDTEELQNDHGIDDDEDDAVSIAQRRDFEFWHEVLRYTGPEDKIHPSGIATSTVDVSKYQTPPPTPTLTKDKHKLRKSPSLAQSVLKLLTRSKTPHDAPPSPQLPAGYKPNATISAPSTVSKASTRSSVGSATPLLKGFPSFRKDKGDMAGSVRSSRSRTKRDEEQPRDSRESRAYTPSVHSYAPSHSSRNEQIVNVNVNITPAMLATTPTLAPAPTSKPASTRSRPASERSVATVIAPTATTPVPAGPRRLPSVTSVAPTAPSSARKPPPPPLAPLVRDAPTTIVIPSSTSAASTVLLANATPQVAKVATRAPAQVVSVKSVATPAQVVVLPAPAAPAPTPVAKPAPAPAQVVVVPAAVPAPSKPIPLVKEVPIVMPTSRPPAQVVVVPAGSRPVSRIVVLPATLAAAAPASQVSAPIAPPVVVVPAPPVASVPPPAVVTPTPAPAPMMASIPVSVPPAAVPVSTPVALAVALAPVVAPAPSVAPPPVPTPVPAAAPPSPEPARVEVLEKHVDVVTPQGDKIEKVTTTTTTTAPKPKTPSVAPAPVPRPAPQVVVNKPVQHVVNTPPAPAAAPPASVPIPPALAPATPKVDRVEVVERIIVPAGTAPEAVEKALDTLAKVEACEAKSRAASKPLPEANPKSQPSVPAPAPGTKAGLEPIKMVDYKSLIKRKPVKQWPPPKPGSKTAAPAPHQSLPKRASSVVDKAASIPLPPSPVKDAASVPLPPSPVKDATSVPLPPSPVKNPASVPLPPSPVKNPASVPLPPSPVKNPASVALPPCPVKTPASILLPSSQGKNPASVPLPPSPTKASSKAAAVASKHEKSPSISIKETEKATKSQPGEVVISIGGPKAEQPSESKGKSAEKSKPEDSAPKSQPGEVTISIGEKKEEKVEAPKNSPSKEKTDAVKAAIAKIELKGGVNVELAATAAVPIPPSRPASIRSVHSTKSHHRADSLRSIRSVRSTKSTVEAPNVTTITAGGTKIEVAVAEPQKAGSVVLPPLAKIVGASKHKHSASTPSLPSLKKAADEVDCIDVSVHKTSNGDEVTAKIHSHARWGSAPPSVVGEGKKKDKGETGSKKDEHKAESKKGTQESGSKKDKEERRQSHGHKHGSDDTNAKADKKDKNETSNEGGKDDAHKHGRKDSQKLAPKEVVHEADSDLEIDIVQKDIPDGKSTAIAIRRKASKESINRSREGSPSKSHHHHDSHRHDSHQSLGQRRTHEKHHSRRDSHGASHERHHPLGQHHDHKKHHRRRSSMDSKRHHHYRPSSGEDSDSDGSFYSTRSRASRQSRGGSFDIPRPPLGQQRPYLPAPMPPAMGVPVHHGPMYGPGMAHMPGMPGMINLHGMAASVGVPGIGYASGHPIVVPMGAPAPVPPVALGAVPVVPGVPMGWAGAHGAPHPLGSRPPPRM